MGTIYHFRTKKPMKEPLKELIHEKVEDSYTFKEDLKRAHSLEEKLRVVAEFVNQNYTPKPNKL